MSELFASARVVDLILALMLFEAVMLIVIRATTSRGIPTLDLLCNLLAGAGLLLALRGALLGVKWWWIALPLLLALGGHVVDLWRRWRVAAGRPDSTPVRL